MPELSVRQALSFCITAADLPKDETFCPGCAAAAHATHPMLPEEVFVLMSDSVIVLLKKA